MPSLSVQSGSGGEVEIGDTICINGVAADFERLKPRDLETDIDEYRGREVAVTNIVFNACISDFGGVLLYFEANMENYEKAWYSYKIHREAVVKMVAAPWTAHGYLELASDDTRITLTGNSGPVNLSNRLSFYRNDAKSSCSFVAL